MIPLLDDETDLAEVFLACTEGKLNEVRIGVNLTFACNVVLAAAGYPGSYRQGDAIEISGIPAGTESAQFPKALVSVLTSTFQMSSYSTLVQRQ